jgi:hypothetical protein
VQIEHAFQGADKPKGLNFSVDMLDSTDEGGVFSYSFFCSDKATAFHLSKWVNRH